MKVPFNDLYAQYLTIKAEIDQAISSTIASSSFIRGPAVSKFEELFSHEIGVKNTVSCANGTDGLYLAMRALGLRPGDEVIVPAHSWISTSETVTQAGGEVVFCDVEESRFTLDPVCVEKKINEKTVGIIPVHLFGQSADMDPIMELARKNNLWVIEDCAQAHLAEYKGQKVGSFGEAGTFSFYPGKNLGAMGDAGAVVTNDSDLAVKMAMLARHGGLSKGEHRIEGVNSRLDGLQAAILEVKLKYLAKWTMRRRSIAAKYTKLLSNSAIVSVPHEAEHCEHVWHLYVLKTEYRDELIKFLGEKGVSTVVNYPVALPFLPAYSRFGYDMVDFPAAFKNQSRILSLPIYPEMTDEMIVYVVDCIFDFERSVGK
jgi:dTDP-4-amino-4,6-dideoxygalactose transaminase